MISGILWTHVYIPRCSARTCAYKSERLRNRFVFCEKWNRHCRGSAQLIEQLQPFARKKLKKEGKRDSLMRVGYVTWTSITRKSPGNAGRTCNCGTCTREKSGAILMGPYVLRNCVNRRDSIAQTCLSLLWLLRWRRSARSDPVVILPHDFRSNRPRRRPRLMDTIN